MTYSRRCHMTIEIDGVTIIASYIDPPLYTPATSFTWTVLVEAVFIPDGLPPVAAMATEVGKWYTLNQRTWQLTPARLPI